MDFYTLKSDVDLAEVKQDVVYYINFVCQTEIVGTVFTESTQTVLRFAVRNGGLDGREAVVMELLGHLGINDANSTLVKADRL